MLPKYAALIAAVVVVVVIVVAYYALTYAQYPSTSSTSITSSLAPTTSANVTAAQLAIANASLLTLQQLPYAANYSKVFTTTTYAAPCNAKVFSLAYQNSATLGAANYSLLNENVPFAVFELVYVFGTPVYNLSQVGYCPLLNRTSASSYSSYVQTYAQTSLSGIGSQARLTKYDDYNSAGLNFTNTPYTGQMPHLSSYALTAVYGNYVVLVNVWGFYGHMNVSQMAGYANYTLSRLK